MIFSWKYDTFVTFFIRGNDKSNRKINKPKTN